jgi:hypothetical protein
MRVPERHPADWSSLVAGLSFAAVGVFALVAGRESFSDAFPWVWSGLLLGLGIALLLRGTSGSSARKDCAGDEVHAERREDGEVQQAGRGHDG